MTTTPDSDRSGAATSLTNLSDPKCGSLCLYLSLKSLDLFPDEYAVLDRKMGQPGPNGYSLEQLDLMAQKYGAQTRAVSTTLANILERRGRFAVIALIKPGHFVCVYDIKDDLAYIADPPELRQVPLTTLKSIWSGEALLISREPLPSESSIAGSKSLRMIALRVVAAVLVGVTASLFVVAWRRRRRKFVGFMVAFVSLSMIGCGSTATDITEKNPRLVVSADSVDLGTVLAGASTHAEGSLTLSNPGNAPLRLNGIASSCGCTVAGKVADRIEPKSSVTVPIRVSVGSQAGPRSSQVKIFSNDPEQIEKRIEIRWRVEYAVSLTPEALDFGEVRPDTLTNRTVRYKINKKAGLHPPVFESKSVALRLKGPDQSDDQASDGSIVVTLDSRGVGEVGSTSFTVKYADEPLMMIPVHWKVVSEHSATPAAEFLSNLSPGENLERKYVIKSNNNKPFRLKSIAKDDLVLSTQFDGDRSSTLHVLAVTYKAPQSSGVHSGRLQLTGDDFPGMTIPVTVVVK
jgi:hypothetical protein